MSNSTEKPAIEEMTILKVGTCPSLSGRSTLTYHLGCDTKKAVFISLVENTGAGIFSKAWIPLAQLDPLLASEEKPITSGVLRSMFQGKSVNTVGFLVAALIAEKLLKVADEKLRTYERIDPTEFKKAIAARMESKVLPQLDIKPAKVKEKKKEVPIVDSQEKEAC